MSGSISQARITLDQLLKQLADKEESAILDDVIKEPDRSVDSQPTTPRKRPSSSGNRTPRKRAKKELLSQEIENQANSQAQQTYIQKLFDRSVDFAKYNKATSLYVLARAWMKNKPRAVGNESFSPSSSKMGNIPNVESICSLPPPDPVESNNAVSTIPEMFPRPHISGIKLENELVEPLEGADLLNQHMARWKEVRRRWKDASHNNQRRYLSSIRTIRKLFNQQL